MRKKILILMCLVITPLLINAQENINRGFAIDKSFLYHNSFDNAPLKFVDKVPQQKKFIIDQKEAIKPTIIVELYSTISKDKIKGENKFLKIYNALRDYKSMENIKYYSVSDNKANTLFKTSYPTNSSWKKRDYKDLTSIPNTEKIYFYQKDLTLGDNKNIANFKYQNNAIISHFKNHNTLEYFFLDVVSKSNLQTIFIVKENGDNFDFYVLSFVKPSALPLIKERISKSFGNRVVAMYNWFYTQVTR